MSHATSGTPGRVVLDWRNATASEPAPCVLCGRPALCRSPATGVPCHKTCAETWITDRARTPADRARLIARYTPGTPEAAS